MEKDMQTIGERTAFMFGPPVFNDPDCKGDEPGMDHPIVVDKLNVPEEPMISVARLIDRPYTYHVRSEHGHFRVYSTPAMPSPQKEWELEHDATGNMERPDWKRVATFPTRKEALQHAIDEIVKRYAAKN